MKKEVMTIVILFVAGIFSAQLFGSEFFATYGFLNEYHMKSFANVKPDMLALFWNVLWERGKFFVLITILCFTPAKRLLGIALCTLFSYTLGLYMAACVLNVGLAGIGVAVVSLLPQWIFYLVVILLLLRQRKPMFYQSKRRGVRMTVYIAVVLILYVTGALLESTVGTWMLQEVLQKL